MGCENVFAGCRGVKRGIEKNVHFLCLSFLCWIKQMRKDNKTGKRKLQKKTSKIVFLGGCEEKGSFLLNGILEKLANIICVRKVKKRAFFVAGKWPFFVPIQSHQTLQK